MSDSLDVCVFSPGLPHTGSTLLERSLGGSETAALHMARCLAARGHNVTVFSPGGQGVHDRVAYRPIEEAAPFLTTVPHDVLVISRLLDFGRLPTLSKVKLLWCHDLALKRQRGLMMGILYALDAVYVLSGFHRTQYKQIYGLPDETLLVTRNGVDLRSFQGLEYLPRDPTKLLYASRPERGLETALNLMARLGGQGSPLVLHVAGYENTPPEMAEWYNAMFSRAKQMPNVRVVGWLKQGDWHKELATARALIYPGCPGEFREISGIVFMEAQAAGTPTVACHKGAIPETCIPQTCRFVGDEESDPNADTYQRAFVEELNLLATDDILWRSMSFACRERASTLDWSDVAEQWEQDWYRRLAARAADPYRLSRHFARIGEKDAAAFLFAAETPPPEAQDMALGVAAEA